MRRISRLERLLRMRSRDAEAHDLLMGPIRGEPLGSEHLAERARTVARTQQLLGHQKRMSLRKPRGLARVDETRRIVTAARVHLDAAPQMEVGPAGDWLLDNFYVIDRQLREIREGLPKSYYRELPTLAAGVLAGEPRIFELAMTLIAHTEGRVDGENLELFIGAAQEVSPLSLGELWALPSMMRLALIENIRRLTLRTVRRLDELEDADEWAARIEAAGERGEGELRDVLRSFVARPQPLTPTFVSRLLHQLRVTASSSPPLAKLEHWIAEEELSADDAAARSSQQLALTQLMMANSITSLVAISRLDAVAFVERQSATEAALRADPSGAYQRMTPPTRDAYRHQVERIARHSTATEVQVAELAVSLAQKSASSCTESELDRRVHVGYFLIDAGRAELEAAAGYRIPWRERARQWVLRHPHLLFFGGIATTTLACLGLLASALPQVSLSAMALVVFFAWLPVLDLAVNVVNQLITKFVPPHRLPKLQVGTTDDGVELVTAVAVPVLLGSVEAVTEALHNLEVQYLSNPEPYLRFVLLSDFTDAATENHPADANILAAAVAGIRALNGRYTSREDGDGRFHLLHRPRRFDAGEGCWIGWERKRGKLAQLNAFLRDRAGEAFSCIEGDSAALKQARFVITLDADTMLPAESAAELVGTLAHPLNRPVFDPATNHVVRGYGVLQPRVVVSLPSAYASRFAALHSGRPGMDPYTTAVSDVYQDLYGEGSYSGKGIYDVDAFERATHDRFPEQTLLSHDLIEGSYARAGLVTDVSVYDDYPARYLTYTRRKHRWIRGDWQLLPWLRGQVPSASGRKPNSLSGLARFKIADNLRRSVTEMAQLALIVAGLFVLPGRALDWCLLSAVIIAAPWLVSLTLAAIRPPFDQSWTAYYTHLARDAGLALQQSVLVLVFLPHQAWTSGDAIVRTLSRLFTRKHLLEWRTAEQSERGASGSALETFRNMAPATLLALLLLAAVAAYRALGDAALHLTPAEALSILLLLLAWLSAPWVAYRLSLPARPRRALLSSAQLATVQRQARLHWEFFERFTNAETHWLTPDNFQDDPAPVVAMRTSPTNIGLQLLATVSAHDLGFISLAEMAARLTSAFDTIDTLPRHEGHLFNWYSLETLAVLQPAYVSTVDSGNLAGHCIALRQACLTLASDAQNSEFAARLENIGARAYRLVSEMSFGFLYDGDRKLFAIGYQPGTRALDSSYYDLLASESRLASFVAIAKNEAPVEHWFRLGRTLTHESGETALVSWSGSMFEYLMPALVMRSFQGTLLDQTHRGAVRRQIAYGRARHVPWGVSESAYNVRDRHMTYQYRAFGVPDLALKRGLGRDLVVAPYASVLALLVEPKRAIANIERLEKLGMAGAYGLRDALDYTRPDAGKQHAIVSTYMAHHIGMGLVALTNVLTEDLWQRRFHADPLVQSVELLLQERVPRRVAYMPPSPAQADEVATAHSSEASGERSFDDVDTSEPHIALLGQLPYTLMISHCGSGYSRFEDLAVTRFRADGTSDDSGQFCYLKDLTRDRVWSAAHQPVCAQPDYYRAVLAPHRVTFRRLDDLIETQTEIAVVPEDAAEIRRLTVTNRSEERRILELTSYGEIVLAPPDADRAHPAFSNLFVETEWHAWCSAITATRRPRSAKDRSLVCVHVVAAEPAHEKSVSYETDRAGFLGRGRSVRSPAALDDEGPLSGATGAVLDPIFALRVRIELEPGETAQVAFTTLVAATREAAFVLADRYRHLQAAQRAFDLAFTSTQVELHELQVSQADAGVFQEFAGALLYTTPALRAPMDELLRNRGSQALLWEQGISGDWPIVLATIEAQAGLQTLRHLFAAHHYWRRRGMMVDLVVLNLQPSLYLQELTNEITAGLFGSSDSGMLDRPGGVFMRRRDLLTPETLRMLRATARVHVHCDGQTLERMIGRGPSKDTKAARPAPLPSPRAPQQARRKGRSAIGSAIEDLAERAREKLREPRVELAENAESGSAGSAPATRASLLFENGLGGLTQTGAYQIRIEGSTRPPAPWANVVANPRGGFVVSEQGGGFAWAESSYFFRLTPWRNDPVGDAPGEVLYLRDESSGEVWSATPAPLPGAHAYTVEHGAGSSTFAHEHAGIATHLTLGLAEHTAVKISRLQLTNRSERARRISVTAYVEWTLGVLREHTQHQVQTSFDASARAIFARNFFSPHFASWVAFCATTEEVTSHSGARQSFLGRNGTLAMPAGLLAARLDGLTGAGIDPCAALQHVLELAPGETRELSILLGAAASEAEARALLATVATKESAAAAVSRTQESWAERLSVITVRTPDPAFDAMINHWTLYQALACRMWARSALYQSSGAYGFRDQLQDVMAFVYAEPSLAREHILRAAARQFTEGDVQHWWHDGAGQGVRTRFSDDLAWLPYVVAHYVRTTGDLAILEEQVSFLSMRALAADEHEIYAEPRVASERASLREHCLRALRTACTEGPHGLPLMGSGDWNDGMNLVGARGRGESVWLAWFLISALRAFEPLMRPLDADVSAQLLRAADRYTAAVDTHGWDGAWYRRAYFDDGGALGTSADDECRIDSIAQSWSVISGAGTQARQALALQAFDRELVDEQARLVLLLAPPFDKTPRDPGYIKGYLPGVRENGAQYTHAALWSVLAYALRRDGDRAFHLYQLLNPLTHTRTASDVAVYKVEPYVVAADVYSAPGQRGRGGWTWYTGSASWMYRVGLEAILGFDKRGDTLYIAPVVPAAWPGFSIEYRYGKSLYVIDVVTSSDGKAQTIVDGRAVDGGGIPLVDDAARHRVLVSTLPRPSA